MTLASKLGLQSTSGGCFFWADGYAAIILPRAPICAPVGLGSQVRRLAQATSSPPPCPPTTPSPTMPTGIWCPRLNFPREETSCASC